jgi:hypothetical protein
MAPFEALYGRRCRTPLSWSQTGEHKIFGPELVVEAEEKVKVVQENLRATQSWQKSYFDKRGKPLKFNGGDHVYLRVSPTRGVQHFRIRGKLAPRYIGPYEIIKECGPVAYRLRLLRSSLQSMVSFTYLSSRNVSEFQLRSLNSKKSMWNQIFHTSNILSEHWIRKKEALVERWWKCIKFSGLITLRKKPLGRQRTISIDISRVFLALPQVPLSLSLLHSSNLGMRFFFRG